MELNIERSTLTIKIGEQKYEVQYPTLGELESFQEKSKSLKDENMLEHELDFLESLGLPKDVARNHLQAKHLKQIFEEFTNTDEKKS